MVSLNHLVHLERDVDAGTEDAYGQPVTTTEVGGQFRASIQQKSAREVALVAQSGANIGDWTIFMLPRLVTTADKIVHDASACPIGDVDLADVVFELTAVRNAAGAGHHLEIDARAIGAALAVAGS